MPVSNPLPVISLQQTQVIPDTGLKRTIFKYCLILVFSSPFIQGLAQTTPALERTVSVSANNERMDIFLKKLSVESGCVFSYSSNALDVNRTVNGEFRNQTTREVLEIVFDGDVVIKPKGAYVILTPPPRSKKEVIVSGYVVDDASGDKISKATIYNPVTLRSTTTDEFGYFQMKMKKPSPEDYKLIIKKLDYSDTVVVAPQKRSSFQRISLRVEKEKINSIANGIAKPAEKFWAWTKNSVGKINQNNVHDSLHRTWQVSFVPFIGTNRKMSANVTNDFSFNILGGYSAGTNKAELGGLFNINTGNVKAVQLAGIFNLDGGWMKGVQLAGITNINNASTQGAQIAGIANINNGYTTGFQLSGITNINQDSVQSASIAGFANINNLTVRGLQLAGFLNLANSNVKGVQFSGFANIAGNEVDGAQIGFINIGKNIRGTQLGFINVAKTHRSAPVGFLSFVGKGYHSLELGADEIIPFNIAFRTGVRSFYNILMAGARPEQSDSATWSFGYGIGSSVSIGKTSFLNFELTAQQVYKGNVEALNLFNRLYIGYEQKLGKTVALYAGPALTLRVYDTTYEQHPSTFKYYKPNILSEKFYPDQNLTSQLWLGFRFGLRLF
jgi:hypothetical protein